MKGGDLVLKAFDTLGGDPSEAVTAARSFASPTTWIRTQSTQTAVAGAGAMLVPGVHLLALGVDLGLVMHKVAYTAWGVGELLGCPVDGKLDLALVLATWTDTVDAAMLANASDVASAGLVVGAVTVVGVPAFTADLIAAVSGEAATAVVGSLAAKAGHLTTAKSADFLVGKTAEASLPYFAKKVMAKTSPKIAAKIAAASAGKLVPLVGAAVAAAVNAIIIRSVGRAAVRYYTAKREASFYRY